MSIEQKIAEVLEKSKLNQNTLNEEVEQDDPDLDEGESDEDMDEVLDILENSQLDELSKKTLGSYIIKSTQQMHKIGRARENILNRAKESTIAKDESPYHPITDIVDKHNTIAANKLEDKANNRYYGVQKAVNKLTKEEVEYDEVLDILENSQLDEISKATLGSYIKKAALNSTRRGYRSGVEQEGSRASARNPDDHDRYLARMHQVQAKKHFDVSQKRLNGINKATDKLTKEEVDSDATINSLTASDNAKIKRALARQEKSKLTPPGFEQNPDNARNNVDNEDEAANAVSKKPNRVTNGASTQEAMTRINKEDYDVKEDVAALLNGEDLSEEFKTKATTIFEAAIISRVKIEVASLEEEFNVMLDEAITENQKGLVERVDGYLDYIVEQWITQNEIALERGMKSEILEGFVSGLKGLFEEHYIDIPEEKFDVLNSLEEEVSDLEEKLNIQISANIDLNKSINEMKRIEIATEVSVGLSDTDVEKFINLTEEISFEDAETFTTKAKTIRENYFSIKSKVNVKSVVTDSPVDSLTEEKRVDPAMASYLSVLNRK